MVSRKTLIAAGAVTAAGTFVAITRMAATTEAPGLTLADSGLKRREFATPAGRMTVYEAGEGKPMVFLHGIGGGASSWTWAFVAPDFIAKHRVIVPDWIGWGCSEHPARAILFDDYVASLEVLLDDIGEPVVIVAQSLACGFAMALAEQRPDLVSQMVFNTPSGGKDFGGDAFGPLARSLITPFARTSGLAHPFYKAVFHRSAFIGGWFRRQGFADASKVTPWIVDAFLYSARQSNAAHSAIPFVTGELRYDIAPYFERLNVPASMFWGAQETQVGLAVGTRLSALRPDIPFVLIQDSKACPELEQPRAVAKVIRNALT